MISVLIPTTGRRLDLLVQVEQAFYAQHGAAVEVLTVAGLTWGAGLNQLARRAEGDYWSCCCDDTVPVPGWFDAARPLVDAGLTPASRYLHPDGSPLHPVDAQAHGTPVSWCRSFLLTPEIFAEVGEFLDCTWYADIDYSERLEASGRRIVACDGYAFTHLAGERDWLTREEEDRSRELYESTRGSARAV